MKKNKTNTWKILLVFLLVGFGLQPYTQAQNFTARDLAKSLVRVKIKGGTYNGEKRGTGYASGFVWQDKLQVVTSLHAMRIGDDIKITVEWTSAPTKEKRGPWKATIKSVHKEADLVLLEVDPGRIGAPEWTPLNKKGSIGIGSDVMTAGYYKSTPAWRRMSLTITETQNNNLRDLPHKLVTTLERFGIPKIDLNIVHFEKNSLLPGFSGAPLVDSKGTLIAIGDGGVDNGGKNISWGIPSQYLDQLLTSNTATLPANLAEAPAHYSAEEPPTEKTHQPKSMLPGNTYSAEEYEEQHLEEVTFGDYEFYYIQTRTIEELIETADNPEQIFGLLHDFIEDYFTIDDPDTWWMHEGAEIINTIASNFSYDIYQDINHGVVIVIPTGTNLKKDEESGALMVDFGDETLNNTYNIMYMYDKAEDEDLSILDTPDILLDTLTYNFRKMLGVPIELNPEATSILKMPGGGLINTAYKIKDNFGGTVGYMPNKVAISDGIFLFALAMLTNYTDATWEQIYRCKDARVNCFDIDVSSSCSGTCQAIILWTYIMTSIQLTTFVDFKASEATIVPVGEAGIGQFEDVWAEHNVYDEYGNMGMRIHAQFSVQNMEGKPCSAIAYFYDEYGDHLPDRNDNYNDMDGDIALGVDFTPPYSSTQYDDFQLFFPYAELDLEGNGLWEVQFVLQLVDNDKNEEITSSSAVSFTYTK